LEGYAAGVLDGFPSWLSLAIEEVEPEREVWRAAEIALAEASKATHLGDGVQPQVVRLNVIKAKETTEVLRGGKSEPSLQEGGEDHEFIGLGIWLRLAARNSPRSGE
jgi:hypothetical protein